MATTINSGYANSPKLTANIADHADVYGGRALVFDGVVDFLTLGNSSIFNHSGNYSISVWIKKIGQPDGNRDTNDNPTIIAKGNVYFTLFVNYDGMLGTFFYNNSNANDYNIKTADGVIKLNVWHHVVLTWNNTSSQLYVDGKQEYSGSYTPYNLNTGVNGTEIRIGDKESPSSDSRWHGNMCDMKIFDSHLTEAQVTELYRKPENTPSAVQDNLVAWYPMCESNPESPQSIVYDHSEKKLGSEIVNDPSLDTALANGATNANFKLSGDGEITNGAWSFTSGGGVGRLTVMQDASTQYTFVSGKLYKLQFTIVSSGNALLNLDFVNSSYINYGNGTHTLYAFGDGGVFQIQASASGNSFTLTDISFKEVRMGNHAQTNFFGSELNPNPTFSNFTGNVPDGWGVVGDDDSGNNISQGSAGGLRLQSDGGSIFAHLADVNVVGKTYQFSITITNVNDDDFSLKTLGTKFFDGNGKSAGTYTGTYVAEATYVRIFRDADCDVEITALSIKEVGISSSGFDTAVNEPVVPQVPLMRYNQKMFFDGETDQHVSLGSQSMSGNEQTISAWIVINGFVDTTPTVITFGKTMLQMNSSTITYYSNVQTGTTLSVSKSLTVKKLYHIVVTKDSSGNGKLYLNGVLEETDTSLANINNDSASSYIGRYASDYFDGTIDDLSIFNTALNQTQVQELFNDGLALDSTTHSQSANLIGYWRNDGLTTWKDRSTNSNNGTVQGTPDSITIREGLNSNRDGLGFYFTNPSSNVLRLNGSSDFVAIDSTNSFPSGDQSRSITCWIKPSSLSGDQPIIFTGTYASNQMFTLAFLSANPTKISVWGYSNDNTGTDVLTTDNWWYVGVTYDSGTNTLKSYIGGGANNIDPALDINNTSTTNYNTTYGDVRIGRASTQDKYFDGIVDEVKIYNKALSADEILKDFKHQKGKHKND